MMLSHHWCFSLFLPFLPDINEKIYLENCFVATFWKRISCGFPFVLRKLLSCEQSRRLRCCDAILSGSHLLMGAPAASRPGVTLSGRELLVCWPWAVVTRCQAGPLGGPAPTASTGLCPC